MLNFSESALKDADVLLYVTDVVEKPDKNMDFVQKVQAMDIPVLLLINKIDLSNQEALGKLVEEWHQMLPKAEIIPISATARFNIDGVMKRIKDLLPDSPPYFEKDQWTDKPARFFVTEIIREKILLYYDKEIPYAVEGYGIIYNDAIMRKYFALPDKAVSISSAEEITSFETLKAVVEDMSKHLDELGIQGVFASTSFMPGSEWRWTTHLVNPALWAEFGDLATAQAAKEFKFTASENFRNLFDLYLNNSITAKGMVGARADADSMSEFALGQVAMVQNGNWAAAQILGTAGNTVADEDIKFLPLYMGLDGEENYGICVGTENYLAFNKNASPEALEGADVFLTWLFSSGEGKAIVTNDLMFITPFSSFSADEVPDDPLARQVNIWMNKDGITSVPWVFNGIPSEQWKADFAQAMLEYINGNYTWDQVTKVAQDAWAREAELAGR